MQNNDDWLAIYNLQVRYAVALDHRDWELLRTVFTPDCEVQYSGAPLLEGFEAVWPFCQRALARYRQTQHLLGDHVIDIDGDRATGSCYLQAIHVDAPEHGTQVYTFYGRYTDEYVRSADGWRIAKRRLENWANERRELTG
jgi:hypothetical protein